ncbi:hypothetical protein BX666DRAFT_1925043 [Dichotomocladium elegans]|nr:hypothetical protein BX666DRAFT_1925043 [Dichotomocladium elegans]
MPWHDISLCMLGGPVLDVGRHFCERWNYVKHEKYMDDERYLFLKPALGGFGHHQRFEIPGEDEVPAHQVYRFMHGTRGVTGTCRAQVLRSASDWSLGLNEKEQSIQNAYISSILSAEHFVYIENQFFITSTEADEDYVLKNLIGEAIVKRIVRAHEECEPFRVIVLMPLMPAFPADLSTDAAATARMVMNYQYMSICRGGKSIIEKLTDCGIEASDYISFFSLRSHDVLRRRKIEEHLIRVDGYNQTVEDEVDYAAVSEYGEEELKNADFVSEELYIHAKLMIVDDRLVIMGSANLNDRSQCGDRDSEIALLVEDQDMIPSLMNGREYEAGRFAATLRRQLWKEHLGLLGEERALDDVNENMMPLPVPNIDFTGSDEDNLVMDPLSEETIALLKDTARTNTEAFREVFHCVPDDNVTTWDQYKEFYPDANAIDICHVHDPDMSVETIQDNLSRVRGHLVEFPLDFLKDEELDSGSIPLISDFTEELYT